MSDTLLKDIDDLIKQATTERNHYYTASLLERVRAEIIRLRAAKGYSDNLNLQAIIDAQHAEIKRLREFEWMYEGLSK